MAAEAQTFAFHAEINQLMSLIINSAQSNKEIFLRELVSNASGALDKIRHQSPIDKEKLSAEERMEIKIVVDKANKTLSITDTGIGMTKADMVRNLGTVARSGAKAFMEALEAGSDVSTVGQFGVGFYSAYLVSDKVQVVSKHDEDECQLWESAAGGTFTVSKFDDDTMKRGTRVICYIKDDQIEYLEEVRITGLVQQLSECTPHRILIEFERTTGPAASDKTDRSSEEAPSTPTPRSSSPEDEAAAPTAQGQVAFVGYTENLDHVRAQEGQDKAKSWVHQQTAKEGSANPSK